MGVLPGFAKPDELIALKFVTAVVAVVAADANIDCMDTRTAVVVATAVVVLDCTAALRGHFDRLQH